jgi:hypothetical protein
LITNGIDEGSFLDNIEIEKKKCTVEIMRLKATAWDTMYANEDTILIDTNPSVDQITISQRATLRDIREKESIVNEFNRKVKDFEALCATVHDVIVEISEFLRRDDQSLIPRYPVYALIPDICNLPKDIPLMSPSTGRPSLHVQSTLLRIEKYMQNIIEEKNKELIEAKSKHFDQIFEDSCVE